MKDKLILLQFNKDKHVFLINELTKILNEVYNPIDKFNSNEYSSKPQSADETLKKLKQGDSFLGFIGDELMATITLVKSNNGNLCSWYNKNKVCYITQYAIKPSYRGYGLGCKTIGYIESYAKDSGFEEIALEVKNQSEKLISSYKDLGYRVIEDVKRSYSKQDSLVLSKSI